MSDKLCLDVGGTVFHTTYTTLSRERESMLARMFGGELRPAAEELGRHFIDRDGTHFRYILNYLRDGTVALPHDEQLQKELLVEANYYGLDGFVEGLRMGFPDMARLQPTLPGKRLTLVLSGTNIPTSTPRWHWFLTASVNVGHVAPHHDPDMEKVLSKRRSREAHESLKRFLDAHGLAQHNPCQELGVWCSTEPRPVILFDKGYYIGRDQSDCYLSLLLLAKVEWLALL